MLKNINTMAKKTRRAKPLTAKNTLKSGRYGKGGKLK